MISGMSSTTPRSPRPSAVNFAIIILLVSTGWSLARHAVRADWGNPFVYIQFGCELVMLYIPLWFIFRGKNWARWIMVAWAVGGICVSLSSLMQNLHAGSASWIVTHYWRSLAEVVALFALFLHSSNQWFRGHTNAHAG